MKTFGLAAVIVLLATAAASTSFAGSGATVNGISGSGAQLLVVGPVEATSVADATATILGQRVRTVMAGQLTVGNTVAVYGTTGVDGSITASAIQSRGLYVPGATSIFLFGTVQRAEPSLGRVVVNGVTVDLTPLMSYGMLSPAVGSKVAVSGTQPVSGGRLLVNGISGSGATVNGISGSGATVNGISGSGTSVNGISGSGTSVNGISGSGASVNGISGSGTSVNGISGSGATVNGISGSGTSVNGISGSGATVNGISGSGATVNGISGSGATVNGISGS